MAITLQEIIDAASPTLSTIEVDLLDNTTTDLAATLPPKTKIDGLNPVVGQKGLFTNLDTDNNRIYTIDTVTAIENTTWEDQDSPTGNWGNMVWAAELGLFVAVNAGSQNYVMTSPDGINWTSRPAAAGNAWQAVVWSPELSLLVAVCPGGGTSTGVMTSPDGINWTARATPSSGSWYGVAWAPELTLFTAVAASGDIMTSPDGINWTDQTPATTSLLRDITWAPGVGPGLGRFVAVASSGTGRVVTSEDGIVWTSRSIASQAWYSVVWSPELSLFCAVGNTGKAATSTDGITWAATNTPDTSNWAEVIWASGLSLFVATSLSGASNLITSPDGIVWESRTVTTSSRRAAIAWSPELSLLVTANTTVSTSSPSLNLSWTNTPPFNGSAPTPALGEEVVITGGGKSNGSIATWGGSSFIVQEDREPALSDIEVNIHDDSSVTLPTGTVSLGFEIDSVPVVDKQKVLFTNLSSDNNRIYSLNATTLEGEGWESQTAPSENWRSVTWSPELNLFVALSTNGGDIMTSTDGITWAAATVPDSNQWYDVTWAPGLGAGLGLFAAVASSGTNRVMTSEDGITWIPRTAPLSPWKKITWSPDLGIFVATATFSGTDRMMTSTDGITWAANTDAPTSRDWYGVAWSPSLTLFVVVNGSGAQSERVMTSPDGLAWTFRNAAENNSWEDVAWSPELSLFVAVSDSGSNRVMSSTDGINWAVRTSPISSWQKIVWADGLGLFVAISASNAIRVMTSPDGLTWTSRTEAESNSWFGLAYAPSLNKLVAVSSSGTNRVMTSTDILELSWDEGANYNGKSTTPALGEELIITDGTYAGNIANWNGTEFIYQNADAIVSATGSIDTHSDVDVSTVAPSTNDALVFDGTNWAPGVIGGGIAGLVDDPTPQLGADLDIDTFKITTTAANQGLAFGNNVSAPHAYSVVFGQAGSTLAPYDFAISNGTGSNFGGFKLHFRVDGTTSDVHIGKAVNQTPTAAAENRLMLHTTLASFQSRSTNLKAHDTLTETYDLIFPDAAPTVNGQILSADTSGNLSWSPAPIITAWTDIGSGTWVNVTKGTTGLEEATRWRRVGDGIELDVLLRLGTGGDVTNGLIFDFGATFPGLTMGGMGNEDWVGQARFYNSVSPGFRETGAAYGDVSANRIQFYSSSDSTSVVNATTPNNWQAADVISFKISFAVVEWAGTGVNS